MGEMNLLSASVNGKLGELYGTKQYGNHYLKAIPFSHAPHSQQQTKAVRAFEKLNRLAGGISSIAFPYLNLSDKKMLKHNAVARWLKPIIVNKTFDVSKISDIIENDGSTEIVSLDTEFSTNTITVNARTSERVSIVDKKRWFVIVFDNYGTVFLAESPTTDFLIKSVVTPLSVGRSYYAMAFRSDMGQKKYRVHGLSITVPLVIVDGILYTSRTPDPENWVYEDGIARYIGDSWVVQNGLLRLI